MPRPKARWIGRLFSHGIHRVTGDHDPYYTVRLTIELERDRERLVELIFSDPGEAERIGRSIMDKAVEARSKNIKDAASRFSSAGGDTDVHTEHCCLWDGCKYGAYDCPVQTGVKPQSSPCEQCDETP